MRKEPYDLLNWALAMLEGKYFGDDDFFFGLQAYDAWMAFMANENLFDASEEELKQILNMHTTYTGQLAESRAWADSFFSSIFPSLLPEYSGLIKEAATLCKNVHDLMWKVWGALGSEPGDTSVWAMLKDEAVRKDTITIIENAKKQDTRLAELIKKIMYEHFAVEAK